MELFPNDIFLMIDYEPKLMITFETTCPLNCSLCTKFKFSIGFRFFFAKKDLVDPIYLDLITQSSNNRWSMITPTQTLCRKTPGNPHLAPIRSPQRHTPSQNSKPAALNNNHLLHLLRLHLLQLESLHRTQRMRDTIHNNTLDTKTHSQPPQHANLVNTSDLASINHCVHTILLATSNWVA